MNKNYDVFNIVFATVQYPHVPFIQWKNALTKQSGVYHAPYSASHWSHVRFRANLILLPSGAFMTRLPAADIWPLFLLFYGQFLLIATTRFKLEIIRLSLRFVTHKNGRIDLV